MTEYAICFDFPEMEGDPWFAAIVDHVFAFTTTLDNAKRFDSEAVAERVLANAYGDGTRPFGTVVEVGS